jgi:hypothetical protein
LSFEMSWCPMTVGMVSSLMVGSERSYKASTIS